MRRALRPHEQQSAGDYQRLQHARGDPPDADPDRGTAYFQLGFLRGQRSFLYGERGSLEFGPTSLLFMFRYSRESRFYRKWDRKNRQ